MSGFSKTTTRTFRAEWVRREFLPYNEGYRKARARMRTKMNQCFKCNHRFGEGEMMALACFGSAGNKVLCQSCSDEMEAR